MTNVILLRKGSEEKTVASITKQMENKCVIRHTGDVFPTNTKLVFRWGCTADLPKNGETVVNKAGAIHTVANKPYFRKIIRDNAPDIIPITWFSEDKFSHILTINSHLPVIVRPNKHEKGSDFYYCSTIDEIEKATDKCKEGWYISKYYNKKQEFRVFFVQGRVAFLVEKIPFNKKLHSWGNAGKWVNYKWGDWPLEIIKKALKAFQLSKLDFGSVDVIVGENDSSYVCEINTATQLDDSYPEWKVAQCFDWVVENGHEPISVGSAENNWKDFIHPALSEKAR